MSSRQFSGKSVIDDARDSSRSQKTPKGLHHGKACIQVDDNCWRHPTNISIYLSIHNSWLEVAFWRLWIT
jgi:hypothetical protein